MNEVEILVCEDTKPTFLEIAEWLWYTISKNYLCEIVDKFSDNPSVKKIHFGANHLCKEEPDSVDEEIPSECIVINMEQLCRKSKWLTPAYIRLLTTRKVWDYSDFNIQWLNENLGIKAEKWSIDYCPLMLLPSLQEQDIDILFFGWKTDRRMLIKKELEKANVSLYFDMYWSKERDDLIRRSKIVLNIHAVPDYEVLEITRIGPLLANGVFVITETCRTVYEYDRLLPGMVSCSFDDIPDTCIKYLAMPEERQRIAKLGHDLYTIHPMTHPSF